MCYGKIISLNIRPEVPYLFTAETLQITLEEQTLPLLEPQKIREFREALPGDEYLINVRDTQVLCTAIVYNIETLKTAKATVVYLSSKKRKEATSQAIKEAKRLTD